MSPKRVLSIALLAVLLFAWTDAAQARKHRGDPMNIEDGALDEIHLQVQSISGQVPVVIHLFSIDGTDFGTGDEGGKEKRVLAAETMEKIAPQMLADSLKAELQQGGAFGPVTIAGADGGSVPDGALVIEGHFVSINPGSRAKRYWVGFGAGASGVGITGKVTDASGKVLAEFKHRKHSGIGIGGGDYVKFLSDDTQDVGKDVAFFLTTWARGGDLTNDR